MSWYYQVIPVQKEVPVVFRVGVGKSEEEDKKKKKLFEKLFIHRRWRWQKQKQEQTKFYDLQREITEDSKIQRFFQIFSNF